MINVLIFTIFQLFSTSAFSQTFVGVEKSEATFKINNSLEGLRKEFYSVDGFKHETNRERLKAFALSYDGTIYCEDKRTENNIVKFYSQNGLIIMEIFNKRKIETFKGVIKSEDVYKSLSNENFFFLKSDKGIIKLLSFYSTKLSRWWVGSIWFENNSTVCAIQTYPLGK